MNNEQVNELLLQSLEHERGGIQVYETALKCESYAGVRTLTRQFPFGSAFTPGAAALQSTATETCSIGSAHPQMATSASA